MAGGISQRMLAQKWNVPCGTLSQRARREGWRAGRDGEARRGGEAKADAQAGDAAGEDAEIALRVRRKLLLRLESVTDAIPDGLVTEVKTQEDSVVKMFRLKDLTAAYKDVAGDIPKGEDAREETNIILDV